LLLPYLTTPVNPDIILADVALLVLLLGALVIASNTYVRRVRRRASGSRIAILSYSGFSAGLLVAFAGFLLANQVACSCPPTPLEVPCPCDVPLYDLMFYAGLVIASLGTGGAVAFAFISGSRPIGTPRVEGAGMSGSGWLTYRESASASRTSLAGPAGDPLPSCKISAKS